MLLLTKYMTHWPYKLPVLRFSDAQLTKTHILIYYTKSKGYLIFWHYLISKSYSWIIKYESLASMVCHQWFFTTYTFTLTARGSLSIPVSWSLTSSWTRSRSGVSIIACKLCSCINSISSIYCRFAVCDLSMWQA